MPRRTNDPGAPHSAPDTSAEVAALLATLARVPRAELPDGAAREALAEAIRCGEVDGLYTPVGRAQHNVTLADVAPDVDPRLTVAEWRDWWDTGRSPRDELLARHREAQTRGLEMLRAWEAQRQSERQTEQGGQNHAADR